MNVVIPMVRLLLHISLSVYFVLDSGELNYYTGGTM